MPSINGFCGPSYKLSTPYAAADRAINCYPEVLERGPRSGQPRLVSAPGLELFYQLPEGPIRALFAGDNRLLAVAGAHLYELPQQPMDSHGNPVVVGAPIVNVPLPVPPAAPVPTGALINYGYVGPATNPAIITTDGNVLCIASGGQLYFAPGDSPAFRIQDIEGGLLTCATVAYQDNYFIGAYVNSKTVIVSNLPDPILGIQFDPGNEAEKEGYSDNISRVWVDQPGGEYLWLFGNDTTEVWMDTGGLFPFTRVQSMVFPIGCDSAWAVAGTEGQRFWLWKGIVWTATGFQPLRISDFGVEQAIAGYSFYDQTNAEAFCYLEGGHLFYVLTFPEAGATWVYDSLTGSWHERYYLQNGQLTRYRPRCYAKVWGQHFVGDYATGAIYIMSNEIYVDAPPINNITTFNAGLGRFASGPPMPLLRRRVCPYITNNMQNQRYNRLTLDMEVGVGAVVGKQLNAFVGGQGAPPNLVGYDPNVTLRYSRNRGNTWSDELVQSVGATGEYDLRPIFTQLGSSRIGMAFEVSMTDPVPFMINGADLDIGPGSWPRP